MNWNSVFRDVVSGRQRGIAAAATRGMLRLAAVPYTWIVVWRNHRYDRQSAFTHRISVPVISVGNLTLGGTGKTPMVKWISRWLVQRSIQPAIVSRGYRANKGGPNDEALELAQAVPHVPHIQDRDRVAAANAAIVQESAQVIVADDAFQHRRLARDLEIVLIDAIEPFGFDHVFPRGTLREPLQGLRRAELVCLTRADMVDQDQRRAIEARVRSFHPLVRWCEVIHRPNQLLSASGAYQSLTSLAGKQVAAFCGIGNPTGFRHTLGNIGCRVLHWQEFPDHHLYTSADAEALERWAAKSGASAVVCTHKDLVKLGVGQLGGLPLWAVSIEMEILAGREHLEAALERIAVMAEASRLDHPNAIDATSTNLCNRHSAPAE